MILSPESAEHGVVPAVLEVVHSFPASTGALRSILAEKLLLTPTPSVSISPQRMQLSPFGGTLPTLPRMICMCFCLGFVGIMQNEFVKTREKWICVHVPCALWHLM